MIEMSKKKKILLILLSIPVAMMIFGLGFLITYMIFEYDGPTERVELTASVEDSEPEPEPKPAPVKKVRKPLSEELISELINNERAKLGLNALTTNSLLNSAACQKLDHMLANNYWSHNSPDGVTPWYFFDLVGYGRLNAGENLGYGFMTERGLVRGWMKSPGHKANILGDYAEMGMCSKRGDFQGSENATLVVNMFATPL